MRTKTKILRSRIVSLIAILVLMCSGMFSGCSFKTSSENGTTIVCTIFPIYDWAKEITKGMDNVNVVLLAKNGSDMHSFQPTVQDMVTIADSNIFIYVGGESEEWIEDCLSQNPNEQRTDISLMEVLSDETLEESSEGIAVEEEEEGEDGEVENDEHIWLSLRRSKICVEAIADAVCQKTGSEIPMSNASSYTALIDELDGEYSSFFTDNDVTITIADRFPFRYLTADYNIKYFAAFSGCTTETDASFDTIIELSKNFASSGEKVIYITESGDEELAKAVMEQAGVDGTIKVLNSMQSVSSKDIENNASYLSYMRENLETFKTGGK